MEPSQTSPIISPTPRVEIVRGPIASGRTEALVCAVSEVEDPADAIVFCARASAIEPMRARLAERMGARAESMRVTTPLAFELQILSAPDARRQTGRTGRVASDYEMRLFDQELLATGVKPRRLREMVKFFYKSWTELADDSEGWLITNEEHTVHAALKESLAFTGALAPCEVSNLCFHLLKDNPALAAAVGAGNVFADDYLCYNRASQGVISLIAQDSLFVTTGTHKAIECEDPYPYANGVEELIAANPACRIQDLEHRCQPANLAAAAANCSVLAAEDPDAGKLAPAEVELVAHPFPDDAIEGIAQSIEDEVNRGVPADGIFVAVWNDAWAHGVQGALEKRGIASSYLSGKQPVHGDFRDPKRCQAPRLLAMLQLAADDSDTGAWRTWCGSGDLLGCSPGFRELRNWANDEGLGFLDALDRASMQKDLSTEAGKVCARYREGRTILNEVAGLRGEELVSALERRVCDGERVGSFEQLLEAAPPNATAGQLAACASSALLFPAFAREGVRIGNASAAVGQRFETVYLAGFMNGIVPPRSFLEYDTGVEQHRKRMRTRIGIELEALFGCARRNVVAFVSDKATLEEATRQNLQIKRIRMENGRRVCLIAPSAFLDTVRGQGIPPVS